MESIINLLSPEQVQFIISTYGSVSEWFSQYAGMASITIEDIML